MASTINIELIDKVRFVIILEDISSISQLEQYFSNHQGDFPDQYIFSRNEVYDAIRRIEALNIKYRLHYQLIPNTFTDFPAYKLFPPISEDISEHIRISSLMNTIVSNKVKNIFDNFCANVSWTKHNNSYFCLTKCDELQIPIRIECADKIFKNSKSNHSYTVISNGMEIINQTDIEALNKVGILSYTSVSVNNEIFNIPKTYIISPAVRQALSNDNILPESIFPFIHNDKTFIETVKSHR